MCTENNNNKLNIVSKPVAPYLSKYKPQHTSMVSIFGRVTGLVLFFAIFSYILASTVFEEGCSFYFIYSLVSELVVGDSLFLLALYNLVVFSGIYHLIFALRFLFWTLNGGKYLSIQQSARVYFVLYILVPFVLTFLFFLVS